MNETTGEKTGFFEEGPGNRSVMRLMMFIWGMYAVVLTSFVWWQTKDYVATLAVFTSISGVAALGKVGQKVVEKNQQSAISNQQSNNG